MTDAPRRFAWPKPDKFTLMLIGTVLLATLLPARGGFVPVVDVIGRISIILLFFLHGANLSTQAVMQAHGASLTAGNEPGGGARFDLHLPLAPA